MLWGPNICDHVESLCLCHLKLIIRQLAHSFIECKCQTSVAKFCALSAIRISSGITKGLYLYKEGLLQGQIIARLKVSRWAVKGTKTLCRNSINCIQSMTTPSEDQYTKLSSLRVRKAPSSPIQTPISSRSVRRTLSCSVSEDK